MFFAEDLILFGEATKKQAQFMEKIMTEFCNIFGQQVNLAKSRLFVSLNVGFNKARVLSNNFDITLTNDLGKYIGVPFLHSRMGAKHFGYVIDKVRKKLNWWKAKFLSKVAKRILIQTTILLFQLTLCKRLSFQFQ